MLDRIREFWDNEEGLTSVEYALLLALIVVVAISTWTALARAIPTHAVGIATNVMKP